MHPTQLTGLDLNLLLVADTLFETLSVTETATAVNLSQPAVSRALGRLREQLGDPLLIRERRSMVLTPFAQRLKPRLRSALHQLERAVAELDPFDPAVATGTVTIACADYADVAFVPGAVRRLAVVAPGVELTTLPYCEPFEEVLETNEADVVIGPRRSEKSWIRAHPLFRSRWVCVAATGHPYGAAPTLDAFCAADHLMVSPRGRGDGPVDLQLEHLGRTRRVRVRVPQFAGALTAVAQSNLLLVVPEVLARAAINVLPIRAHPLPFEMPTDDVFLCWHAARDDEERLAWLRETVVEVVQAQLGRPSGYPEDRAGSLSHRNLSKAIELLPTAHATSTE